MAKYDLPESNWNIESLDRARAKQAKDYEEYFGGMITGPELALRTLGNTASVPSGMLAGAFDAITPTVRFNGKTAGEHFQESDFGQKTAQWMQENPRATRNLEAGLNVAEMFPLAKGTGMGMNALAKSLDAEIPNFYDRPDPVSKAYYTGKEAGTTVPDLAMDMMSPQRQAAKRVTNMPTHRRDEIANKPDKNYDMASAITADNIQRQMGKDVGQGVPMVSQGPIGKANFIDQGINAKTEKARVRQGITSYTDVPDDVADRLLNDVYANYVDNDRGTVEFAIKRPDAPSGKTPSLETELIGSAPTSFMATRLMYGDGTKQAFGKFMKNLEGRESPDMTQRDYVEFLSVGGAIDKAFVYEFNKALGWKKGDSTLKVQPNKVVELMLKARHKKANGIALNERERTVMSTWGWLDKRPATIKDGNGTILSNADPSKVVSGDGKMFLSGSHHSASKELGGVHDTMAFDYNTGDVYSIISDGSDLFGMNPAGGHSLITVSPIHKFNIQKPAGQRYEAMKTRDPEVELLSAKELELETGIPMKPKENPINYNKRVIAEVGQNAKPELQDYMSAAKDTAATAGYFGLLTGDTQLTDPNQ